MFRNSVLPKLCALRISKPAFRFPPDQVFPEAGKKLFRGKVLNKSFQARCRSKGFPGEVPPAKSAKFQAKQGSEGRCEGKVLKQGMFQGFSHVQRNQILPGLHKDKVPTRFLNAGSSKTTQSVKDNVPNYYLEVDQK